jgi:uncharacterized protein (UPF0147 family)
MPAKWLRLLFNALNKWLANLNLVIRKKMLEVVLMNEEITKIMEEILSDRGVPRNIRAKVEEALAKVKQNTVTSLSESIYFLDDISNDVNMPDHTRTDIWHLISLIEEAKEKMK